MTTISLRIDSNLVMQAEREARIENRSKAKQIEYWAKLGRIISSKLNIADVFAITQGIKELKLEMTQPFQTKGISTDEIFGNLEKDRIKGMLSQKITSSKIYYEASLSKKGYLDQINSTTGERQTGQFENGMFKVY
ncbi:hypothetical protein QUF70_08305 [Desulfobacterales bacterium HSG17]|nr:hypothetical protein [Desulfobacterales bacterium HSG17]